MAVGTTGLVLLTVLVRFGYTRAVDLAIRDHFRPGDRWGDAQIRADVIVEGFRPSHLYAALVVVGLAWFLLRRDRRVLVALTLVIALSTATTLAIKMLVERVDPHFEMSAVGGSYPSGHIVAVVVCLGGPLLVLPTRVRPGAVVIVALATALMAWSLLLQAAHWATDIAGGALLASVVLAIVRVVAGPSPAARSPAR